MITATISWVVAPISRSVQISSTISYKTPIYVILYVLRDVRTLFMYYFEGSDTFFYIVMIILFWDLLDACVRMIIHFNEIYVTDIYVYELSAYYNSILKMVSNVFIIRCD